jgi:hypothetical protein
MRRVPQHRPVAFDVVHEARHGEVRARSLDATMIVAQADTMQNSKEKSLKN